MTAIAWDTVVALALAASAAAWLFARAWRTFARRTGGGCACPSSTETGACGSAEGKDAAWQDVARKAVARAEERRSSEP